LHSETHPQNMSIHRKMIELEGESIQFCQVLTALLAMKYFWIINFCVWALALAAACLTNSI